MGKPTSEMLVYRRSFRRAFVDRHFDIEVFYTEYIGVKKQTRGTETSQYPEERTSIETLLVAASERGPGRDLK